MKNLRLRTKLLLWLVLGSSGLTCATLLIVRSGVHKHALAELDADLQNSLITFGQVQRERELTATRTAKLLADLPIVKALMTVNDAPTVQDASTELWHVVGSDLLLILDRSENIVALHSTAPGLTAATAQQLFQRSGRSERSAQWWFSGGHLFQVFFEPIYFGAATDNLAGMLGVGYEINDRVARDISRVAGSQVAFRYGGAIVVSTLPPPQQAQLAAELSRVGHLGGAPQGRELRVGSERFLSTSVNLAGGAQAPVSLVVFKSYEQATLFLGGMNRLLLTLGVLAIAAGTLLVFVISEKFTRPLGQLVDGVRALGRGDFSYPLETRGSDELAELTTAFARMRTNLQQTQRQLLQAERLATIGQMATSISHDLRHPLSAVIANSEFLCDSRRSETEREELYDEIRHAVNQTTDLVESLLEFSRGRETLRLSRANLPELLQWVIRAVRARSEFAATDIELHCRPELSVVCDPAKLRRALQNILLNACEAVAPNHGRVEVTAQQTGTAVEIIVADTGSGIPESIRDTVFQPFVSSGKASGTGLGLAIARKILQDHAGDVELQHTSAAGTAFRLTLPLMATEAGVSSSAASGVLSYRV